MACGILVPRPGVEPKTSAVKAPSPNHWTAREFPITEFLNVIFNILRHTGEYYRTFVHFLLVGWDLKGNGGGFLSFLA